MNPVLIVGIALSKGMTASKYNNILLALRHWIPFGTSVSGRIYFVVFKRWAIHCNTDRQFSICVVTVFHYELPFDKLICWLILCDMYSSMNPIRPLRPNIVGYFILANIRYFSSA